MMGQLRKQAATSGVTYMLCSVLKSETHPNPLPPAMLAIEKTPSQGATYNMTSKGLWLQNPNRVGVGNPCEWLIYLQSYTTQPPTNTCGSKLHTKAALTMEIP